MKFICAALVLSLFTHTVWTQGSTRKTYGDGSYCITCASGVPGSVDDPALGDAVSCGLDAVLLNGCFAPLLNDQCGDPTKMDTRFNSITGKACTAVGSCLTSCGGIVGPSFVVDWCCFKPNSPFIDEYVSSSGGTVSPPPSVGQPAPKEGIPCDVVDAIVKNYETAKSVSDDTLGYYGQVVNIICLRSACPNAACSRVDKKRSKKEKCQDLSQDMPFEKNVFSRIAKEASDPVKIAEKAASADKAGERIRNYLVYAETTLGGFSFWPLVNGLDNARSWGALWAGVGHFLEQLEPFFSDYIKDLVNNTPDDAKLSAALAALKQEHETFFECAVTPGFEIEYEEGELPWLPAKMAGTALVPFFAAQFRNYYVWTWLSKSGRVTTVDELRTKYGVQLSHVEELLFDPSPLGTRPGTFFKRAAQNLTYPPDESRVGLMELSSSTSQRAELSIGAAQNFTLTVVNRDADLLPQIAFGHLMCPDKGVGSSVTPVVVNGQNIDLIGPAAVVYPAENNVVLFNTTHAPPLGLSTAPVPLAMHLRRLQSKYSETSSPTPLPADTDILFRKATLSMSYDLAFTRSLGYAISPATDITIFDLVSGLPLEGVVYTPRGNGGTFKATITPGKGSWGRAWGGGGSFGLGLVRTQGGREPPPPLDPQPPTTMVTSGQLTPSLGPLPTSMKFLESVPVGAYIMSGVGGGYPEASATTAGPVIITPSLAPGNISSTTGGNWTVTPSLFEGAAMRKSYEASRALSLGLLGSLVVGWAVL